MPQRTSEAVTSEIRSIGRGVASSRFSVAMVALIGVLSMASPAAAALITYTNAAAFDAATTGITTITFEGLAPVNGFTFFNSPPGLNTSGVNFSATAGTNELFVIDPGFDSPNFIYTSGQFLQNNNFGANSGIVATLPAGTTAVAADVSAQFPPNTTFGLTVTLSSGGVFSFPFTLPTRPTLSFIGFTSDVPITTIQFTSAAGNAVTIDNFQVGQAVVPEPASVLLLGSGLAGLAARRYRRRKS